MNGMQEVSFYLESCVDLWDTELAGLHEEEFWNWLICNYKRFVADCKSYDIRGCLKRATFLF